MPVYEYKCQSCGNIFEVLLPRFESTIDKACSNCGSHDLKRLLSAPNMVMGKGKSSGGTCCGRSERCDQPPCSAGGSCSRH